MMADSAAHWSVAAVAFLFRAWQLCSLGWRVEVSCENFCPHLAQSHWAAHRLSGFGCRVLVHGGGSRMTSRKRETEYADCVFVSVRYLSCLLFAAESEPHNQRAWSVRSNVPAWRMETGGRCLSRWARQLRSLASSPGRRRRR